MFEAEVEARRVDGPTPSRPAPAPAAPDTQISTAGAALAPAVGHLSRRPAPAWAHAAEGQPDVAGRPD
jgi:hypothetical protein